MMKEPASFAFLAGHHEQRRRVMTHETMYEISTILLITEERLLSRPDPFCIIASVLRAYYIKWGWIVTDLKRRGG